MGRETPTDRWKKRVAIGIKNREWVWNEVDEWDYERIEGKEDIIWNSGSNWNSLEDNDDETDY